MNIVRVDVESKLLQPGVSLVAKPFESNIKEWHIEITHEVKCNKKYLDREISEYTIEEINSIFCQFLLDLGVFYEDK